MADPSAAAFDAAAEQARQVTTAPSTDLVVLTSAAPEQVRAGYGSRLAETDRAHQALVAAGEQRAAQLKAQLDAHLAELEKLRGPLEVQLKELQERIWMVNLYLGRDETVELIRDGLPAPDDTPIALRQLVLAMDEECLVAVEQGGVDARRIGDFTAWLTADARHLDQVLPEQKGVVVLVPSRQQRDAGDPWMNMQLAAANSVSHWLIRNGDRLYLMTTDLKVGDRLLPKRSEFVDYFYERPVFGSAERQPLQPGTEAWVAAESKADARRRHFMRIMMVLQGLADRSEVFLPTAAPVNFLSVEAQDNGQVRIINELDNVLSSGRKPFRDWQRDVNASVRKGMRIIGAFSGNPWFHANQNDSRSGRAGHSRLNPATSDVPASHVVHTITGEVYGTQELTFQFDRRVDDIEDGWYHGTRRAKRRGTCTLYTSDGFWLPFDLVTVDDLRAYLNARTERHRYLDMVPVIKAAIAAKEQEAAAEAPFRQMLAGQITLYGQIDVSEAEQAVPDLVHWWKLGNRWHRALVGDQAFEDRATTAIIIEWDARRKREQHGNAGHQSEQPVIRAIRRAVPDAICIAGLAPGTYVAYAPADEGNIWLHEYRFVNPPRRPGLRQTAVRKWVMAHPATLKKMRVLESAPRWGKWNHRAPLSEHLTGPELEQLTNEMVELARGRGVPVAVAYRELRDSTWETTGRLFDAFAWCPEADRSQDTLSDPGDHMNVISARWSRDKAGQAVLGTVHVRRGRWGVFTRPDGRDLPWRPAPSSRDSREVWSDPSQRLLVDELWQQIEQRAKATAARAEQVRAVVMSVRRRARDLDVERERVRFLQDTGGAEDLWPQRLKMLKIEPRVPEHLWNVVNALVDAERDLTGMTVGQAYPTAADKGADVDDDVAGLLLVEPVEN